MPVVVPNPDITSRVMVVSVAKFELEVLMMSSTTEPRLAAWNAIQNAIIEAAELLPSQGPITAFAFLNPLQGMEDRHVDEALRSVAEVYGCEPYLDEGRYFAKLQRGRITVDELREVLAEDLGDTANRVVAGLTIRSDLRLNMLQYRLHTGDERELQWVMAETDALRRLRPEVSHDAREQLLDQTKQWILNEFRKRKSPGTGSPDADRTQVLEDAMEHDSVARIDQWDSQIWERVCLNSLWRQIRRGFSQQPPLTSTATFRKRHSELLNAVTGEDADRLVNEILIAFCSAYLDQGFAHWRLPDRHSGFLSSFCSLYGEQGLPGKRWARGLAAEVQKIMRNDQNALQSIDESLQQLGVDDREMPEFVRSSLLALRGWCGMIWQTEVRPDRVYISSPMGTLVEFLAVRLILDRLALQYLANETLQFGGPLSELRDELQRRLTPRLPASTEQRAFLLFQLAQLHGWSPRQLAGLSRDQWSELIDEIDAFSGHERRRIYQAAFELRLARQALDAIAIRAAQPRQKPEHPQLQVVCCIDAREESFRRHLEEVSPEVETFGTAGFFGVPMYYRGAGDAHFAALCPIVIKPTTWVVEDVVYSLEESHRTRAKARRVLGAASHSLHVGTRSFLGGAFVSTLLGPLATAPLLSRILFPRLAARMHRTARQFVAPPSVTRLRLERPDSEPAGSDDDQIGFTLSEMAAMSERALRDIGLTSGFARCVIFLGHGSSCLNNPHESAYHCGACSGSPGGPNARALAAMLNDVRVRRMLHDRGLHIPDETHFLGGLHNTATEEIMFYDLELLPTNQVRSLRLARELFARVAERNAHERCRRFESARLDISPAEALRHVQNRAEDLAQTRPEYGNGTNALCFVGRRSRIRGLYLDRRSFMMSYDATQDDDRATVLARILGAVIPVCEGINMLYTLSAIDNLGWGSGTKLPHNVTSLLGVMDGAASDLRPGLPWQGVDIHEPVRLLFVIESTPDAMLRIMDDNPTVGRICRNGWAQLALLDPHSAQILRFSGGRFVPFTPGHAELPIAETSLDWYRGNRDHLGFAQIGLVKRSTGLSGADSRLADAANDELSPANSSDAVAVASPIALKPM
jgi:uncharacterized protein YbcC (UPF0753/DUF2309 family)